MEQVSPFTAAAPAGSTSTDPKRRGLPWIVVLALLALFGAVAWKLTRPQTEAVSEPAAAAVPATIVDKKATSTPENPVAKAPPEPAPEVKPAVPATGEPPPATTTADRQVEDAKKHAEAARLLFLTDAMVRKFDDANDLKTKLDCIDEPEKYGDEVKRFFAERKNRIGVQRLEQAGGRVTSFTSGKDEMLFRLITKDCPDGAIIRVREIDGRVVLNWPLFVKSHDYLFDSFVKSEEAPDGAPQWFGVLGQRTHDFELKGPDKDSWLCFQVQGSLSSASATNVYVNKDSPAGRFLDLKTLWNRVYVGDILLGKMDIEGRRVNVILDCEGTRARP